MGIEKENYGVTKEGKQVTKYTLTNGQGASVSFLDYGAVIQSIIVPDKDGKLEDVVLGYDTLSGYESNVPSFGSPVGRCANRISNACFVLNGKEYPLDNNDATNCLHGGFLRYNYLMYDAECATSQDDEVKCVTENMIWAMQYVELTYGSKAEILTNTPTKGVDISGKDIVRACFLSHDPEALFRKL